MSRLNFIALSSLGLLIACSTPSDSLGPLIYREQYASNVSTLYGTMGHERKNLKDTYAPDFHWKRSDGTLDSLSGHQGQIVMINFWATWCAPCQGEMPDIERLSQDLKDSVFVIGVSVDYPGDPFSTVRKFVQDRSLTYQFVVDSAWELYHKYETWDQYSIPHSVFIAADGSWQIDYPQAADEATFRAIIAKLE
jgi:thiol-disulfide isomerase/thioredoxin